MPDDFQPPKLAPHGNSKSLKPYYPTLPSTLTAITASSAKGPKEILSDISAKVGGVLAATDPCSLPRNEQQIVDAKRRQKKVEACGSTSGVDELGVVMQTAYMEDEGNCFIREMRVLREPAIVLALDRQLNDSTNYCTSNLAL